MTAQLLESIHRREGGRILAGLIRRFGDFDLAEEALQDAYARALARWPGDGLPNNPAAWLTAVAQRRAVDLLRAAHRRDVTLDTECEQVPVTDGHEDETTEGYLGDERLRLLFTCCHPALAPSAQVALALRTLCQLTTSDIARAFVEPEATTAQKIVRAKRKIAEAKVPYQVPSPTDLPERLATVLAVIYLVFTTGYSHVGAAKERVDLCREALELGALLDQLLPGLPEVMGLRALMMLHEARRPARLSQDAEWVSLEEQDRSLWDAAAIATATRLLDTALALRQPGPYQLQAAIAALHANAPDAQATDWPQIFALYSALLRYLPTPVVELNAAVALAMATTPERGLEWIERINQRGDLEKYSLLPVAQAELLRRAGRFAESLAACEKALALSDNEMERRFLSTQIAKVSSLTRHSF